MDEIKSLRRQLVAIKRAYNSGALTVRHGETSTTYRSLSEMERIIASLEGQIDDLLGKRRRRSHYVYQTRKGL